MEPIICQDCGEVHSREFRITWIHGAEETLISPDTFGPMSLKTRVGSNTIRKLISQTMDEMANDDK